MRWDPLYPAKKVYAQSPHVSQNLQAEEWHMGEEETACWTDYSGQSINHQTLTTEFESQFVC